MDEEIAAVVKEWHHARRAGESENAVAAPIHRSAALGICPRRFDRRITRSISTIPNLINTIVDKERAVTLRRVNAVAKKYLVRDQRTVVITYPAADEKTSLKGAQ